MKKTCLYAALMSSILLSGCALGASPTQTPLAGSTSLNAPGASVSGYEVQALGNKKIVIKKRIKIVIKKDVNDKKKDDDDKKDNKKDEDDKKKKKNKKVWN